MTDARDSNGNGNGKPINGPYEGQCPWCLRHYGETDSGRNICGAVHQRGAGVCTRPRKHEGDHVACGSTMHHMNQWKRRKTDIYL